MLRRFDPRCALERLLHRVLRWRVTTRIGGTPREGGVLFICYGNICRSPYAAAVFREMRTRGEKDAVESAGFISPGRAPPTAALAAAMRRGIDLREHRSRLVDAELVRSAGWMVVMDVWQERAIRRRYGVARDRIVVLGDLDPQPLVRRGIQDPWSQPDAVFDATYARIDRCVRALLVVLESRAPLPLPAHHRPRTAPLRRRDAARAPAIP